MPHYRIELFGPFRAYRDDEPVPPLPSQRCEELLVYLLLADGVTFARAELARFFWHDTADDRAAALLRQNLYMLQNWLTDDLQCPQLLAIERRQIVVHRSLVTIDVLQFEQATAAAEAHPHRRLAGCRICLEQLSATAPSPGALAALRNTHSAHDSFLSWLEVRFAPVQRAAARLYEARWTAAVRRDHPAEALHMAQAWLDLDPWHEPAQRALIRTLAANGQRAEALRQFQQSQALLKAELDLDVEPATLRLVERIRQNLPPDEDQPAGALREHTRLFGRDQERDLLRAMLNHREHRLTTLVGLGGAGKTLLARAVAAELQHDFTDGSLFVALESVQQPDALLQQLSRALGLPQADSRDALRRICRYLAGREQLLVLDNLEQAHGAAEIIATILNAAPSVVILTTSRSPLHLQRETLVRLDGLPDGPDGNAAVALFLARVEHDDRRRDWRRDLPAITAICRHCGNLPLAVELAAYQARYRPCADLAAALPADLTLLQADFHDLPARQRSMRAVLDAGWHALAPGEQPLLQALSLFRAPFSLALAREVLNTLAPQSTVDQAVQHGIDLGLLRCTTLDELTLQPLVQRYLEQRSCEFPAERQAATQRYRHVLLRLLIEADLRLINAESRRWTQAHAALRDDLIHAWQLAVAAAEHHLLREAAVPLMVFATIDGWAVRFDDLLAAVTTDPLQRLPDPVHRHLLGVRIALFEEHQDERRIAAPLAELLHEPRLSSSAPLLSAADHLPMHLQVPTDTAGSSEPFRLLTAQRLAVADSDDAATAQAEQTFLQALLQARRHGDQRAELRLAGELAVHSSRRGDSAGSMTLLEQSIAFARRLNDRVVLAGFLVQLATIRAASGGDRDRALSELQEAAQIAEQIANPAALRPAVSALGRIMHQAGRHEQAAVYLQRRLQLDCELGFQADTAEALVQYLESLDALARHTAVSTLLAFLVDFPALSPPLRARTAAVHHRLFGLPLPPADPTADCGAQTLRLLI